MGETLSVIVKKGKVSWQLGAKEYHKVTLHNKVHTRDLLIGKNTGGWLPQGKVQQRIEQEAGFTQSFLCLAMGIGGGLCT